MLTDLPEEWKITFDLINFLESGSEKKLTYTGYVNNKKTEGVGDFLLEYFHDEKKSMNLSVNYFDALGREYFTRIVTGAKGFRIIKIGLNTALNKICSGLNLFISYRITRIKVHCKRWRNKCLKSVEK